MKQIMSLFGFDPTCHSVKTELMAGGTTFLTMCYILAVNPLILGDAGMDKGAVFSATAVSAAVATLVMAVYAKMPLALASGMGLNAFFVYTIVIALGYSWEQALAAVLIEGIVFIILTLLRIRQAIVNAIPENLRYAISVGIGFFIAFIGLKNGGIIVFNEATITAIAPWDTVSLLSAIGILLGGVFMALKVKGALFFAIIIITIIGIPLGVTQIPENFSWVNVPASMKPIAFHIDFSRFLSLDINYYVVVFALLFMDLFDTIGTLLAAVSSLDIKKEDASAKMNRAFMADAIGTTVGALCGTNTVTTYVESTTGIAVGGRTGLTAFTVSILFFLALFFSPLFLIIPSAATASALVLVGVLMIKFVGRIQWSDVTEALPCMLTILLMPLTGSISEGIVLGMLSYIIVKIFTRRTAQLTWVMYLIGFIFILKYIVPLLSK